MPTMRPCLHPSRCRVLTPATNTTQVGFAAVSTAVAHYMVAAGGAFHSLDTLTKITAHLGTLIGAVTLTGSAVAFAKLRGIISSAALVLPGKQLISLALLAVCASAARTLLAATTAAAGVTALAVTAAAGGALGLQITAAVGGADMPVIITLLNSLSGYALCAEGFMMSNDLLVAVGALIGSSGATPRILMTAIELQEIPHRASTAVHRWFCGSLRTIHTYGTATACCTYNSSTADEIPLPACRRDSVVHHVQGDESQPDQRHPRWCADWRGR
jgi:hypothetical protein